MVRGRGLARSPSPKGRTIPPPYLGLLPVPFSSFSATRLHDSPCSTSPSYTRLEVNRVPGPKERKGLKGWALRAESWVPLSSVIF